MLPEIGRWQRKHADKFSIALITRGSPEANRAKTAEHGLHGVLLQRDWEVSEAYHVTGTPSAVLVRPDGAIGSAVALGEDAIQALVDRALVAPPLGPMPGRALPTATVVANGAATNGAVHLPAELEVSTLGEPAPAVSLPDLNGKPVDLVDFRGSETLLLFWNPDCGFCQQTLPDLKSWERKAPAGAPKLLVVSRGTSAANKAMGLRSPVVLDQDFAVGKALGAPGTPSAVLVDAQGKIASQIVVGAADVLELAASGAAQQEQGSPAAV
jgi:peroxiredoxin